MLFIKGVVFAAPFLCVCIATSRHQKFHQYLHFNVLFL